MARPADGLVAFVHLRWVVPRRCGRWGMSLCHHTFASAGMRWPLVVLGSGSSGPSSPCPQFTRPKEQSAADGLPFRSVEVDVEAVQREDRGAGRHDRAVNLATGVVA